MAMSVLQKPFQKDPNVCGVWCSIKQDWIHNGTRNECHNWKHIEEEKEEEINRKKWKEEWDKKGYVQ